PSLRTHVHRQALPGRRAGAHRAREPRRRGRPAARGSERPGPRDGGVCPVVAHAHEASPLPRPDRDLRRPGPARGLRPRVPLPHSRPRRGSGRLQGEAAAELRGSLKRRAQPPRFTMASNAAFSSGMTLSRDWRTRGIERSALSALISSSVTGRLSFLTGARSTATHPASLAVGSGYASRVTSHTPTTAVPTTQW